MSAVVIDRNAVLEITRHVRRKKRGAPKARRSNATLRQSNATLKCEYAATATATRAEDNAILSKVSNCKGVKLLPLRVGMFSLLFFPLSNHSVR